MDPCSLFYNLLYFLWDLSIPNVLYMRAYLPSFLNRDLRKSLNAVHSIFLRILCPIRFIPCEPPQLAVMKPSVVASLLLAATTEAHTIFQV